MQARRDAGRFQLGQVPVQGGEERVPPRAEDGAHVPQVTVELAAGEEVGERQLIEDRRAAVGQQLGLGDRPDELPGQDQPTEPQARRQRLARRTGVGDAIGVQALDGADGCAVVAELGVVVVLEHQRARALRPCEYRRPRRRRQHAARRPLVRRREDEDVGVQVRHRVHADAVLPHRHADHLQVERLPDRPGVVDRRGILHGQPPRAAGGEHAREQVDRLRVAVRDDHRVGVGDGSADPVEVGRELGPELDRAAAVEIAEPLAGRLREDAAHRAQPSGAREGLEVAAAVAEVDDWPGRARRPRRCHRRRLAAPAATCV